MILNNLSILPFYPVTTADPTPQERQKWWVYGNIYPLFTPGVPPIQIKGSVQRFELWRTRPDGNGGTMVGYVYPDGTKVIDGQTYTYLKETAMPALTVGRYMLETRIDNNYAVSDIFTVVSPDILDAYLKLEWWDDNDLIMDDGIIVYTSGNTNVYKNILYLPTDLAKPEYVFEEEGENRDGYFFPIKQISEKRYRFRFLAPEYILDVMRFIRMSDHIQITYRGQVYNADTFLMTPTWEGNGDLANVECEFDTNTVAKKIGRLITP